MDVTNAVEQTCQEFKAQVAGRFREMESKMQCPRLLVDLWPQLPAELVSRINQHNAAVGDYEQQRAALVQSAGELPALVTTDAQSADLVAKAAGLRARGFELLRVHVKLLRARKPLLQGVAEHLAGQVRVAAADLVKVKEKTGKTLEKAGLGMNERVRTINPSAAKIQFDHQVNKAEPVRQAEVQAETLEREYNRVSEYCRVIESDAAVVQQYLVGSFQRLVGQVA